MSTPITSQTLVLVLDRPDETLQAVAEAASWRIRQGYPLRDVARELLFDEPSTLVVQVNGLNEVASAAALAADVRHVCHQSRLYAWAVEHEPAIEKAMRSNGAHLYLAGRTGLRVLQLTSAGARPHAEAPVEPVTDAEDLPPPRAVLPAATDTASSTN